MEVVRASLVRELFSHTGDLGSRSYYFNDAPGRTTSGKLYSNKNNTFKFFNANDL